MSSTTILGPARPTSTLDSLHEQSLDLRLRLAELRDWIADAPAGPAPSHGALLVLVNERLVEVAISAAEIADTAARERDELARISRRDALTNLPNRTLMLDRLDQSIIVARRNGSSIAVLFLDLNGFKQINDTLGHPVGDEVLRIVAKRLQASVREADTVSRHGGDEFLILLRDITTRDDAARIAGDMLASIAQPVMIGPHRLELSASIGIALHPIDGEDAATLIGCADKAMYRARRRGRGTFEFFGTGGADSDLADAPRSAADAVLDNEHPDVLMMARSPAARRRQAKRLANLKEANQQLVLAMLGAQDRAVRADEARISQLRFLAMVAHELRNPLHPVTMAAGMLGREGNTPMLNGELRGIIERQLAHMLRLVDDLLDVSQLTVGRFALERTQVDLADVLRIALEICQPSFDRRHQRLLMSTCPALPALYGDANRLVQVFSNLLDNASKYTQESGEITVVVKLEPRAIVVAIADNGIGITAEALPNIFGMFVQDPHARAMRRGGVGIGLAIVHELIEAHGGTVKVRSAGIGLGSCFTISLPLPDAMPSA